MPLSKALVYIVLWAFFGASAIYLFSIYGFNTQKNNQIFNFLSLKRVKFYYSGPLSLIH